MKDFGGVILVLLWTLAFVALLAAVTVLPAWLVFRAVWALEAIAKALQ